MIGGLLSSTLLTLVVVPVIYSLIDGATVRIRALAARTLRAGRAALEVESRAAG